MPGATFGALLLSLTLTGCFFSASKKKPWHTSDAEAVRILDRALKQGRKVRLAVMGRAVVDMSRQELSIYDVKKEGWEEARTVLEREGMVEHFQRQFEGNQGLEILLKKETDAIQLGRKMDDRDRPLEQEAVEIAGFAKATHLVYWTLTRIPYGQYNILDKMTLKLIEISTGRTLSIEAFQEVKK